ncbi:hypothetical protein T492DRAFT_838705 [Pavlovales sp. CCMP2436]|nr:hypothetical protein T492DRAFT_838705 [Pavlovales sp. CCMP2436]
MWHIKNAETLARGTARKGAERKDARIVAVIVRAPTAKALLFALGVSCQLAQLQADTSSFGGSARDEALPVLLSSPTAPAICLSSHALARAVRAYLQKLDLGYEVHSESRWERYPLDLPKDVSIHLELPELVAFAGSYGSTAEGLELLLGEARARAGGSDTAAPRAEVPEERALASAVRAGLRASNFKQVNLVVGVVIKRLGQGATHSSHSHHRADLTGGWPEAPPDLECAFADERRYNTRRTSSTAHWLLQTVYPKPEFQAPLGAFLATRALLSGAMALKLSGVNLSVRSWVQQKPLHNTVEELEEVLAVERSLMPLLEPSGSSRSTSRPRTRRSRSAGAAEHRSTSPKSFGDTSIHKRLSFYESDLPKLQRVPRPAPFLHRLAQMVGEMQSPHVRLELLRFLLGLDSRFTLDVLRSSLAFLLECAHRFPPDAELSACVEPGVPLKRSQSTPSLAARHSVAGAGRPPGAASIPRSPLPLHRAASML